MQRRPWKDRLARNVEEISAELAARFTQETGANAKLAPVMFLNWLGLKQTPTAFKRIKALKDKQ